MYVRYVGTYFAKVQSKVFLQITLTAGGQLIILA